MKTVMSALTFSVAVVPLLAAVAGCESNEIPLAKQDKTIIINPAKAEDLPRDLRPGKGSSAGMRYDPSGVNGPPEK
jgi:hypothetical protein